MLVFSCRLWTFVIRNREQSLGGGWTQVLSPSVLGEGVWAGPWWQALAELALLLMTVSLTWNDGDSMASPVLHYRIGRISLMNFHCQHLISVVVVLSTMNTKNMLFLSIAKADEILEGLLSALDWAAFPCRPCSPTTSIFSSWFSGSPHCTSSAALQLQVNPAEALLMISRGFCLITYIPMCLYSTKSLTHIQLLLHSNSHILLRQLGWQPQHSLSAQLVMPA